MPLHTYNEVFCTYLGATYCKIERICYNTSLKGHRGKGKGGAVNGKNKISNHRTS
jgi:hypothetical protein